MNAEEEEEALEERFKTLEDSDERLQRTCGGHLDKIGTKLEPSVNSILDRAKLTLLNEKVELHSLKSSVESDASMSSPDFKDIDNRLQRYKSVNSQLPTLLDNVEKFVTSGQATTLLEFQEKE